jgi:hypothetical protein
MIYLWYCHMGSREMIQSVNYDNYDDFQHGNFIVLLPPKKWFHYFEDYLMTKLTWGGGESIVASILWLSSDKRCTKDATSCRAGASCEHNEVTDNNTRYVCNKFEEISLLATNPFAWMGGGGCQIRSDQITPYQATPHLLSLYSECEEEQ